MLETLRQNLAAGLQHLSVRLQWAGTKYQSLARVYMEKMIAGSPL